MGREELRADGGEELSEAAAGWEEVVERAPDYPPCEIRIRIGLDTDPVLVDDGGLAPWILQAAFQELSRSYDAVWELTPNEEEE